ncbi:hypothetical protein [Acetonema longum]|uniref:Uncharacterized protein n=1 Tax=Acetonema longum DSM 6540 TaxID=1009370 RepID=F7NLZ2_9FIRM|nr:hypothetical protein [Acetonema longum]EGO62918.1 hypothetical protein ALO_15592 [Acetonema longum DSM 6540]
MKKTLVLALAFVFVFGLAATAFAAPGDGVDFGGNVRLRYDNSKDENDTSTDAQTFRIRLDAKAALGEDWKLFARLETAEDFKASSEDTKGTVKFDQLYVQNKNFTVGRYAYIPVFGLVADSYLEGVKLSCERRFQS